MFVKTGIPNEQDKPERCNCFCNHCSVKELFKLYVYYITVEYRFLESSSKKVVSLHLV